jgi:hypothetical protein
MRTNTHIGIDMRFMKSKLGIVRCELSSCLKADAVRGKGIRSGNE